MVDLIRPADLELFLTERFRNQLATRPEPYCSGVVVGREFPPADLPAPERLIIIRDDSGPTTSVITQDVSVGMTVKASTVGDAKALAAMVAAFLPGCVGLEPGNPVAAFLRASGPYAVPDPGGGPTQYLTAEFTVVGSVFSSTN